jgi:hypothetical protein
MGGDPSAARVTLVLFVSSYLSQFFYNFLRTYLRFNNFKSKCAKLLFAHVLRFQ